MEPLRTASAEDLRKILDVWTPVKWPAPPDIVPELIQRLGWKQTTWRRAETTLPVSDRTAVLLIDTESSKVPGGEFTQAKCDVSDSLSEDESATLEGKLLVQAAFGSLLDAMRGPLGPEDGEYTGKSKFVWWDLPTGGRIKLERHSMCVTLYLVSKRYADTDRAEDYYASQGYPIDYETDGTPIFPTLDDR